MALIERPAPALAPVGVGPAQALGAYRRPVATTGWKSWLFTVDHKKLGIMYGVAAFFFFLVGGFEAILIRLQLAQPNGKVLSADAYNQMFTMHATTMVFLFVMPMAAAFANYFVPLQIGARDVAFPRINAFGFWCFLFGGHLPQHVVVPRRRRRRRLVLLRPEQRRDVLAQPRRRLLGARPADHGYRLAHRRDQPDRHRAQHAGTGHEPDEDADLHLDGAGRAVPVAVRRSR